MNRKFQHVFRIIGVLWVILWADARWGVAYPITVTDSSETVVTFTEPPRNAVCLVPAAAEIIVRLGAGDALKGLTWHDAKADPKAIVGGFFSPSLERIEAIAPDVILISPLHRHIREQFSGNASRIIEIESNSIHELYRTIRLLGAIFDNTSAAEDMIREIQEELSLISQKVSRIPPEKRKRVIRLMGSEDSITVPGDDSFQNDFIRAAGGIPPVFGKKGNVIQISLEEWKQFDPQVIYGCGGNQKTAENLFARPGWKDVEAVREGRILDFPCDLTCRASVNAGKFVAWLASGIYEDEFASESNRISKDRRIRLKTLDIPLSYVRSARIEDTVVSDFVNKSLVIEFHEPMRIISTLEGFRSGIRTVGNHYFPAPTWGIAHKIGFDNWKQRIYRAIGRSKTDTSFLFTGADMQNLSIQKAQFKDMTVYAFVTAGVTGNALRMSADEGRFYEPGTINVIIMTNMRLTSRAMTRAIISATEGKTAAMQDMDIRSSSGPGMNQATGTGTDEIIVTEGDGKRIDVAGGHSKMGELIAKVVYDGVTDAVRRQNSLTAQRSIFKRLQERRISLHSLLTECGCVADKDRNTFAQFEAILLNPRYAGFMEAALSLSDAYERGLISNLDDFNSWCQNVSESIAGHRIDHQRQRINSQEIPMVIRMAINAVLNGLFLPTP